MKLAPNDAHALQSELFREPELLRVDQPTSGHMHRDASATEKDAARKVAGFGGRQRVAVLAAIVASEGITRHRISEVATFRNRKGNVQALSLQSVCGRVSELLKAGYVYEDGRDKGRAKLKATPKGIKACRASHSARQAEAGSVLPTGTGRSPRSVSASISGDAR